MKFKDQGFEVITMLIQDKDQKPATVETAKRWVEAYSLDYVVVAADSSVMMRYWGKAKVPLPSTQLLKPGIVVEIHDPFPITEAHVMQILP